MESLLNGMDSILNDSLNQLLSSYPVISTSTSTDSLFLSWNSPLRILSNQLEQLTTLIDQSTAKSSSQEALSFSLKKLIRQVDLSSNGQSEDEDEDQREEADAHPQNQREIQAWRDLFCKLDVVFATRAAGELRGESRVQDGRKMVELNFRPHKQGSALIPSQSLPIQKDSNHELSLAASELVIHFLISHPNRPSLCYLD